MRLLDRRLLIRLDPPEDKVGSLYIPEAYQKVQESGVILLTATDSPYKKKINSRVNFDRALFGCAIDKEHKIVNHKDLLTVDGVPIDDVVMLDPDSHEDTRKVGSLWVAEIDNSYREYNRDLSGLRWGTVSSKGPDCKSLKLGDHICIAAGQYVTRMIGGKKRLFCHSTEVFCKEGEKNEKM